MAINKVVYGNQTLVDLTSDTVTEQDVAQGVTFHDASGMSRTGSASGGAVIKEPMTLDDYQDAQSLDDGIYPIEDDAGTVLDASIIAYGNRTVEQMLDSTIKIGEGISITGIDLNTVGYQTKALSITVPSISGYSRVGYVFGDTSTARWFPMYMRDDLLHYYVASTTAVTGTIIIYPIYKKN